jgi:hypothetical protein
MAIKGPLHDYKHAAAHTFPAGRTNSFGRDPRERVLRDVERIPGRMARTSDVRAPITTSASAFPRKQDSRCAGCSRISISCAYIALRFGPAKDRPHAGLAWGDRAQDAPALASLQVVYLSRPSCGAAEGSRTVATPCLCDPVSAVRSRPLKDRGGATVRGDARGAHDCGDLQEGADVYAQLVRSHTTGRTRSEWHRIGSGEVIRARHDEPGFAGGLNLVNPALGRRS